MYLGVIVCPKDEENVDGRIMLERMSRAKVLTCASKNQNFTEGVYINEAIKRASGVSELLAV